MILPLELTELLSIIASLLEQRQNIQTELGRALKLINELPPGSVVRAEREISIAARLFHYWRPPRPRIFGLSSWLAEIEHLSSFPGLEYVFIFHGDGRLREAALQKIGSGLPSPFLFAAIAWRLNDWAAPVRIAASECAKRVFPLTGADIIAQAAIVLLSRENSWRRWTNERSLLIDALNRADVAKGIVNILMTRKTGGLTAVLQRALQIDALDPYLEQLALGAAQPSVRATALQALLEGEASWPSGFAWRWIDKSMGLRRRIRTFGRRPLTHAVPRRQAILMGVADPSAAVKKAALDALTSYRAEIPDAREIAKHFHHDRVASVRERAAFLLGLLADAK